MLSPESRAVAERLIALLLTLLHALAEPLPDGTRRPILTRLAARAFAAQLESLSDRLARAAAAPATPSGPAPAARPRSAAPRRKQSAPATTPVTPGGRRAFATCLTPRSRAPKTDAAHEALSHA